MYTAARPPTPALCIDLEQSDVESCGNDIEETKEEEVEATECSKPTCNNGRILVGRKESKKVDKKIQNEVSKPGDEEEIECDDGRLIASKVLPIMALLLQRNDREEIDEEKKIPEVPINTSHLQPKLSVQCIQLLPSEPVTSRRH
ncbi:uncharacterized protein [Halyomorpha halys]|uniref:uncharacterized protein isoform X3 n=1 Tax=Halyomorpha halys TaxID=286706 RepID=UPI0034D2770D